MIARSRSGGKRWPGCRTPDAISRAIRAAADSARDIALTGASLGEEAAGSAELIRSIERRVINHLGRACWAEGQHRSDDSPGFRRRFGSQRANVFKSIGPTSDLRCRLYCRLFCLQRRTRGGRG